MLQKLDDLPGDEYECDPPHTECDIWHRANDYSPAGRLYIDQSLIKIIGLEAEMRERPSWVLRQEPPYRRAVTERLQYLEEKGAIADEKLQYTLRFIANDFATLQMPEECLVGRYVPLDARYDNPHVVKTKSHLFRDGWNHQIVDSTNQAQRGR